MADGGDLARSRPRGAPRPDSFRTQTKKEAGRLPDKVVRREAAAGHGDDGSAPGAARASFGGAGNGARGKKKVTEGGGHGTE